jgi:hypothetical protein
VKIVDKDGKPAPLWLVLRLLNADQAKRDEFWATRRSEYRIVP